MGQVKQLVISGRRQPALQARRAEAGLLQRPGDLALDQFGGRAAGVGRGDGHPQVAIDPGNLADDAEVDHADRRHLRVHHLRQHLPGARQVGLVRLAGATVGGDQAGLCLAAQAGDGAAAEQGIDFGCVGHAASTRRLTRSHRGRPAAGTAFRPAGGPGARCAGRACRSGSSSWPAAAPAGWRARTPARR